MTINDLPVGRDVDETLRLLQAFQYTDAHGEGPALLFPFPFSSLGQLRWVPFECALRGGVPGRRR